MKIHKKHRFQNWAQNIHLEIPYLYQPENFEEAIEIIHNHKKVRLVGSGHSWNNLWNETEALIDFSHLTFEPVIHPEILEVEIPAGMKLWQINEFLDSKNLALQNLGSIDQQSIAGAISTGTHGTGLKFSCLASQCTEFTFLDGKGNIHNIYRENPHFYGLLVSFGTLGMILKLKIQVVPSYQIQENTFTCKWENAIENFETWISEYDHFKLWWLPPASELVVYAMKRTQNPIQESNIQNFWREKVLSVWFYRLFVKIGNVYPKLRPRINQFLTSQMSKPYQRTNKSYKIFKVPEPPKHRETEWAFPLWNYKKILTNYFQRYSNTHFTFNFIQEIRISKSDNFWLSPSYERDSLWLGIYNHWDSQWYELLNDFQSFALEYQGRPHWGKEFDTSNFDINQAYPKLNNYYDLKKIYDPEKKFHNLPKS